MGARDDTLALLRAGLSPREISEKRKVTLSTTIGYLNQLVGEGKLRRSDILYSVPRDIRNRIISMIERTPSRSLVSIAIKLDKAAESGEARISRDDTEVVWRYYDARISLGDMYEDLREIEVWLHEFLKQVLQEEFGPDEDGWWRKGVPEVVRKNCQVRREEDAEPAPEPYCYTNIVDLSRIIEKKWALVAARLSGDAASDRRRLLSKLAQLNQIRKKVMHPVRGDAPTEEDFEFVRELKVLLDSQQR